MAKSDHRKDPRVVLDVEDIRIDANPLKIGELMQKLITDSGFRDTFHKDPVSELRAVGIRVPERIRRKITKEKVNATLEKLIENSYGTENAAVLPAVGVSVGTDPGTAPVVIVGVTIATGTSTFSITQKTAPFERKAELWSGLAARQQNQRVKKDDLEKVNKRLKAGSKTSGRKG
jgi:hypothetical protein